MNLGFHLETGTNFALDFPLSADIRTYVSVDFKHVNNESNLSSDCAQNILKIADFSSFLNFGSGKVRLFKVI